MTFFLIFRMNQSHWRYWTSNDTLKDVQVAIRDLHRQFLVYVKGATLVRGTDPEKELLWETRAVAAKTDATRYCIAYCVAFKLHTRMAESYMVGEIDDELKRQVDFDCARLRGLLSLEEYA